MTGRTPSESLFHRYRWAIVGFVIAVAVVFILAPAASSDPDGLDRVSQDENFAEHAEEPGYDLLPDYTIPGIDNEYWSTVLSGVVGVAIVFAVPILLGFALRQVRKGRGTAARPVSRAG
jgi:hypothetical protein